MIINSNFNKTFCEAQENLNRITDKSISDLLEIIFNDEHLDQNRVLLKKSMEADDKENISSAIKEIIDDFKIKKEASIVLKGWIKRKYSKPKIELDEIQKFISSYKSPVKRIWENGTENR